VLEQHLQSPGAKLRTGLSRVSGVDLGAGPIMFGYKLDKVGVPGGVTLVQALTEVVGKARTDLVLIGIGLYVTGDPQAARAWRLARAP
jgi:hypothetical protein